MDKQQQAQRLKVFWKSGRDKYRSFFYELAEVKKVIGARALPNWCRQYLRMDLKIIMMMSGLLTDVDAKNVKAEFADAIAARKEEDEVQRQKRLDEFRAAFATRPPPKKRGRGPGAPDEGLLATVSQQEARIQELEKQLAEAQAKQAEAPPKVAGPLRDRRNYMREFMRKKRAAAKAR
jgi:hypothetical protein